MTVQCLTSAHFFLGWVRYWAPRLSPHWQRSFLCSHPCSTWSELQTLGSSSLCALKSPGTPSPCALTNPDLGNLSYFSPLFPTAFSAGELLGGQITSLWGLVTPSTRKGQRTGIPRFFLKKFRVLLKVVKSFSPHSPFTALSNPKGQTGGSRKLLDS